MTELGNFVATLIGLKWIIKAIIWLIELPFRILLFPIGLICYIILLIVSTYNDRKMDREIKKREETDVVFRYRDIPDVLLADHYIRAKHYNDTAYMEDMKKVMIGRSKKASFEEAFDYYDKLFDEWRFDTNYGFW